MPTASYPRRMMYRFVLALLLLPSISLAAPKTPSSLVLCSKENGELVSRPKCKANETRVTRQALQAPYDPTKCTTGIASETFLNGGFGSVTAVCPVGNYAYNWGYSVRGDRAAYLAGAFLTVVGEGIKYPNAAYISTSQDFTRGYILDGFVFCCPL